MSSEAAEPLEPSPFDPDEEGVPVGRPWKPAIPLTQAELDHYTTMPWEYRIFNPWQCMWNLAAEDGIGYYSGLGRIQCDVMLADPTKSRYCLNHARQMGVYYYSPPELADATAKETNANLTRLVPKATRTLEEVMDDLDAPHGVRAKAAAEILDRTGYVRGVDVRVDAQIATVDITGLIQDRLNSLRDAHIEAVRILADVESEVDSEAESGSVTTVPGEIVVDHEHGDVVDGGGGPAA